MVMDVSFFVATEGKAHGVRKVENLYKNSQFL